MSLLGLFKKSSPKGTLTPEKVKRGRDASEEFIPLLMAKLTTPDGGQHAATILSAASWLTGSSLCRSMNFNHKDPPGTIIQADEINNGWKELIYLLEYYNFQRTDIPVGVWMMEALKDPDAIKPQCEMLFVLDELQEEYYAVMRKHNFDYLGGAQAGIMLCTFLIQLYATNSAMDIKTATGIVTIGIAESAHTVPPHFNYRIA